jgi:hypothetical protein
VNDGTQPEEPLPASNGDPEFQPLSEETVTIQKEDGHQSLLSEIESTNANHLHSTPGTNNEKPHNGQNKATTAKSDFNVEEPEEEESKSFIMPITRFFQGLNCFAPSPELINADEKSKVDLLTGEMSDSMYRRRVAMTVLNYMKMLKLPTSERRYVDMTTAWVLHAATCWISVAGGKGIAEVTIGGAAGETDATFGFLKDFQNNIEGDARREENLRNATVNHVLKEQAFIDWYVMSSYNISIIPPEDDGLPFFSKIHTSAMAAVLQKHPELYTLTKDLKVLPVVFFFSNSCKSLFATLPHFTNRLFCTSSLPSGFMRILKLKTDSFPLF